MTKPVYLHSAMSGAPILNGTNGSLNALFNACLVNGFNTQSVVTATCASGMVTFNFSSAPGFEALSTVTIAGASNATVNGKFRVQSAASNQVLVAIAGVPDGAVAGTITLKYSPLGWTRSYSGTNLGAYRQGGSSATKRYLRLYDGALTSGGTFDVRGYEAMTAISTGTGPFPTVAQAAGNGVPMQGPSIGNTNVPWVLVGTPRAFHLVTGYSGTYTAGAAMVAGDTYQFFFGDPDRVQKPGDTYACSIASGTGYPGGGTPLWMARADTGSAGAVSADLVSPCGANSSYRTQTFGYPDALTGGMTLGDAWAIVQSSPAQMLRGFMPGVLSVWQNTGSTLAPGTVLSGIQGLSGRVLAISSSGHPYSGGMLSLDEDWGDT